MALYEGDDSATSSIQMAESLGRLESPRQPGWPSRVACNGGRLQSATGVESSLNALSRRPSPHRRREEPSEAVDAPQIPPSVAKVMSLGSSPA